MRKNIQTYKICKLFQKERLRAHLDKTGWATCPGDSSSLNIKDATKESQSSRPNDSSLLMGVLRSEAQLTLFLKLLDWKYEEFHYFLLKLSDRSQGSSQTAFIYMCPALYKGDSEYLIKHVGDSSLYIRQVKGENHFSTLFTKKFRNHLYFQNLHQLNSKPKPKFIRLVKL